MALIVAFAVTAASTPVLAALAHRLGIVDRPGPLKVQTRPVAYLGGIAVLAGLLAPVVATRPSVAIPLVAASLLGLVDDVRALPARLRLGAEIGVGVAVPLAVGVSGPVVVPLVVVTVVLVNAVNLIDGLDGLASGVALAAAGGFALVLEGSPRTLAMGLAGALGGFLLWNRPPARVYLGDAGSYLIGTALAVLVAATLRGDGSVPATAAAVLLVGVPVGDTCVAIVRRWRAGRPLLEGDRGHVYDQLTAGGWIASRAALACAAAQGLLAVVAVAIAGRSTMVAVGVAAATVVAAGTWALVRFTAPSGWAE